MKLINYVAANYNQIDIKLLLPASEEQEPETARAVHGMIYFRAL